jgi:hypothetical protein
MKTLRPPSRAQLAPLGQLLAPRANRVQSRLGLAPTRPDNAFVGQRQNLPPMLAYGSLQPRPLGANAFTGGRVSSPQTGLTAPPPPPVSPPRAPQAHGSAAASLASLGLLPQTPHGGSPTPPVSPGGPGVTHDSGATAGTPSPTNTSPAGAPGSSGGYHPPSGPLSGAVLAGLANQGQTYNPLGGPESPLAALIYAAIAANPSQYIPLGSSGTPSGATGAHSQYLF